MPIYPSQYGEKLFVAIVACCTLLLGLLAYQLCADVIEYRSLKLEEASVAVTKHPTTWPIAQPDITWHCGAYQMQAVLRAVGKEVSVNDLYVSKWHRDGITGMAGDHTHTMPWDIKTMLGRNGVTTRTHLRTAYALLPVALQSLHRAHPLIVQIWATKGEHGLHWIGIWGYDKHKRTFLVYDSQYATKENGLGNTEYTPKYLRSRLPLGILWAVEPII
jgi:hypothetical protein